MFFWFAGLSFVTVLSVFSSPALDYRLVMFGAVLPAAEGVLGGPWVLHTLSAPVGVMAAVMLLTQGRRLARRQWLSLPIGMFMHLVLDGSWTETEVFWWPFLGTADVLGGGSVIEFERSPALTVLLEIVGLGVLVLLARRLDLLGEGRRSFVRSGQILRSRMQDQ